MSGSEKPSSEKRQAMGNSAGASKPKSAAQGAPGIHMTTATIEAPPSPTKRRGSEGNPFGRLGRQMKAATSIATSAAQDSKPRDDPRAAGAEPADDTSELRIVYSPSAPIVDIVAIHDVGETLDVAWTYRKKLKRRTHHSRGARGTPAHLPVYGNDGRDNLDAAASDIPVPAQQNRETARPRNSAQEEIGGEIEGTEARRRELTPLPAVEPILQHDGLERSGSPSGGLPSPVRKNKDQTDRTSGVVVEHGEGRFVNGHDPSERPSSANGPEPRVNWLSDPEMLPSEIPSVRVMCYSYPSVDTVPSPQHYLSERANDLISRLREKRKNQSTDRAKVPIVILGLGFGAVIAQKVLVDFQDASMREGVTPRGSDHGMDLSIIAGIALLDAPSPFPDDKLYPRSSSQEERIAWTEDWLSIGYGSEATNVPAKISSPNLWDQFLRAAKTAGIPISWHYAPLATNFRIDDGPESPVFFLKSAHRLSRFDGPDDADYRALVNTIKRSLLAKCCTSRDLSTHLADFLSDNFRFPVDLADQRGQTPLHLAASTGNYDAVRRLVFQGDAAVTARDSYGRSPLSVAVRAAVEQADGERRKGFEHIIKLLLKRNPRLDDKDEDGKTPWDYAAGPGHQWIRKLRNSFLVLGRSLKVGPDFKIEAVVAPSPGSPQRGACDAFIIALTELFLQRKKGKLSEAFNFGFGSVYNVIYKDSYGVSRALDQARPDSFTGQKAICRWIHVPANNEQWICDLFTAIRIQDRSMRGQRHQGSRLIDRYMTPQAKRYRHFHAVTSDTQAAPAPRGRFSSNTGARATSYRSAGQRQTVTGSTKQGPPHSTTGPTAEPARESDAVVLFMPILGFEKHRHRKYLSRAFDKAAAAADVRRDQVARPLFPHSMLGHWRRYLRSQGIAHKSFHGDTEDWSGTSNNVSSTDRLRGAAKPVTKLHAPAPIAEEQESLLLAGYLDSPEIGPVHCRRTLDQFAYYMLGSTEGRDRDQVAYRWARNSNPSIKPMDRPVIMVDQLWLWALQDGTVVSSFPNTWDENEEFNLLKVLNTELLDNDDRPLIQGSQDLFHLVLRTSVDFFKRKGPANLRFHECFQSSINNISERRSRLYSHFCHVTRLLEDDRIDLDKKKEGVSILLSLREETELLAEIMDIEDELGIVNSVLDQQLAVLQELLRLYPKKGKDNAIGDKMQTSQALRNHPQQGISGTGSVPGKSNTTATATNDSTFGPSQPPTSRSVRFQEDSQEDVSPIRSNTTTHGIARHLATTSKGGRAKGKGATSEQRSATSPPAPETEIEILDDRDLMVQTLGIVENNIRVVSDMLTMAGKVEDMLQHLLDLKQKHANGWEARFARQGSEETRRQGNTILFFTLITSVFLPLSFMSSFFALDVDEFPKDAVTSETAWPLSTVAGYVFGFSACIFIPLVFLALYVNELIDVTHGIFKAKTPGAADYPAAGFGEEMKDLGYSHDSDEDRAASVGGGDVQQISVILESGEDDLYYGQTGPELRRILGTYAPMFGSFTFHQRIPLFRRLWRYRRYRKAQNREDRSRWTDTYVTDYPLRRFRSTAFRFINPWLDSPLFRVILLTLCCGNRRLTARFLRERRRGEATRWGRSRGSSGSSDVSYTSNSMTATSSTRSRSAVRTPSSPSGVHRGGWEGRLRHGDHSDDDHPASAVATMFDQMSARLSSSRRPSSSLERAAGPDVDGAGAGIPTVDADAGPALLPVPESRGQEMSGLRAVFSRRRRKAEKSDPEMGRQID